MFHLKPNPSVPYRRNIQAMMVSLLLALALLLGVLPAIAQGPEVGLAGANRTLRGGPHVLRMDR